MKITVSANMTIKEFTQFFISRMLYECQTYDDIIRAAQNKTKKDILDCIKRDFKSNGVDAWARCGQQNKPFYDIKNILYKRFFIEFNSR